ncbi:helix-turn-helix transcriptional regulator [Gordonia sp. LUNF6]|uniref:helix-turn-helix transcriptional regulator n=1 Tax=Gordonia sp. LUNF6 TaxID=3388658 RepID=UPI00399B9A4B
MTGLALVPEPTPEPAPIDPNTLMSPDDLAARLNVSRGQIIQMRYRGQLPPAIKIGRYVRWDPADIETWINSLKEKA